MDRTVEVGFWLTKIARVKVVQGKDNGTQQEKTAQNKPSGDSWIGDHPREDISFLLQRKINHPLFAVLIQWDPLEHGIVMGLMTVQR